MSYDGSIVFDTKLDSDGLKKGLSGLGSIAKTGIKGMTTAIAGVASGMAAAGAACAAFGTEFESSVAKASTLFGDVNVNTDGLKDKLLELSNSTGIAASELGDSLYNALSSGIPATEDMAEAMDFMTQNAKLAKAGFTDIDTAATTTAKVLNAYKMDVSETGKVHKILMQTQNKGITTVGELGQVLAQVTPTASAMGVSFEQVGASLATMTAQGTPTAQATTQLNSMISELGKSGQQANKNLTEAAKGTKYAGMSFQEMMQAGLPLNEMLNMMSDYAVKNDKSLIDMFGSIEAGKAALAMSGQNFDQYTANLQAMSTDADVVGDAYQKVSATVEENVNRIKTNVQNLGIAIYNDSQGMAANVTAVMSDMVSQLTTAFKEKGLGGLVEEMGTVFADIVTKVSAAAPKMIDAAVRMIESFLSGISQNAEQIAKGGISILNSLLSGIGSVLPQLVNTGLAVITTFLKGMTENFPTILKTGANCISEVIKGISNALPDLIPAAIEAILSFAGGLIDNAGQIMEAGESLLSALGEGIINAIPVLIQRIPELLGKLVTKIIESAPKMMEPGGPLLGALADGMINAASENLMPKIGEITTSIKEWFIQFFTQKIPECGKSIVDGLISGITGKMDDIKNGIVTLGGMVLGSIETFFGINSPAKTTKELGEYISEGLADGIKDNNSPEAATQEKAKKIMANYTDTLTDEEKKAIRKTKAVAKEIQDAFNEEWTSVQTDYELGLISEEEKFDELARLRNEYFAVGTKEYLKYTKEINDYEEEAGKERVENALSDLKFKLDMGWIQEEDYYAALAQLRDSHFAYGSEEWRKYTLLLHQYQEKLAQDAEEKLKERKENILSLFQETAREAGKAIDEIESRTQQMKQSLDTGTIYEEITTTIKGGSLTKVWKDGEWVNGDITTSRVSFAPLEEQVRTLEEYETVLAKLKERGMNEAIFEQFAGYSAEEGVKVGQAMLEMTDEEYSRIEHMLSRRGELAGEISERMYSDKMAQAAQGMRRALQEEFLSQVQEEFLDGGRLSAEKFGEGFEEKLQELLPDLSKQVESILINALPDVITNVPEGISQITNNVTYNLNNSRETVRQQLRDADDHNTINIHRGIA